MTVRDDKWALSEVSALGTADDGDYNDNIGGWAVAYVIKEDDKFFLIYSYTPFDDVKGVQGEDEKWKWELTYVED